ncbi:hypothetical protein UlMin_024483 [Ulmus minor]
MEIFYLFLNKKKRKKSKLYKFTPFSLPITKKTHPFCRIMESCSKSRNFHVIIVIVGLCLIHVGECTKSLVVNRAPPQYATGCRKHRAVLTDFGAVGDGKTLNTKAFEKAIHQLSQIVSDGGAMLVVPPGKWLTGSFNLISHFTLFLEKDAVILGSKDESDWPLIPLLPSYGKGRDAPNGRRKSLIFGTNLKDVVISGNNGTINGQGAEWWERYRAGKLTVTRPYLIEIMYSDMIQISNITLLNSPNWVVHPIYSSNIIIKGITILAPTTSANTDGIDPDSCTNTRIEDVYIVSGDDCIALKSGWDEYGIKFGMPTKHVVIKRLTCISPDSPAIAIGSEMSGGVEDVRAEDIVAINTQAGIRIKSSPGRGGYVRDVFARRMNFKSSMEYVFWMTGFYGQHPDHKFDPKAFPVVQNINFKDIVAENATMAAKLEGIPDHPYKGICISNVTISFSKNHKKLLWNCTNVEGITSDAKPKACGLLPEKRGTVCPFPVDKLPIEDVPLRTC